jgi:hypothetical protein
MEGTQLRNDPMGVSAIARLRRMVIRGVCAVGRVDFVTKLAKKQVGVARAADAARIGKAFFVSFARLASLVMNRLIRAARTSRGNPS